MELFGLLYAMALLVISQAQSITTFRKIPYTVMSFEYNTQKLITSINYVSRTQCIAMCGQLTNCGIVLIDSTLCKFYSWSVALSPYSGTDEVWYKPRSSGIMIGLNTTDLTLTSYWPIINQATTNFITGESLVSNSPLFGTDQYGLADGTLKIIDGNSIWQAPSGVYFPGDFTVIAWIKPYSCQSNARFIDFGSGAGIDNILISYSWSAGVCNPRATAMNGSYSPSHVVLSQAMSANQWSHLAVSLCGSTLSVVLGGTYSGSANGISVRNVQRTSNYFGKSNWGGADPNANAEFDEIKIYSRCLNMTEIAYDRNNYKSLYFTIPL